MQFEETVPRYFCSTDYGSSMKPFFNDIQTFGLIWQFSQINLWAFGVFLAKLSAPILALHCDFHPSVVFSTKNFQIYISKI